MDVDKLNLFLGKPVKFHNFNVYPPTVDEISNIGERLFSLHSMYSTFDVESILEAHGNFGMSEDEKEEVLKLSPYDFLTSDSFLIEYTKLSLTFFVKEEVDYEPSGNFFTINGSKFLDEKNFKEFSDLICVCICKKDEKKEIQTLKFRDAKTKKMYEDHLKQKRENERKYNVGLELRHVLLHLCNAGYNSINIFNVGNLTIYQVYQHYEIMQHKENHSRILPIWSNGKQLAENAKLDEWMVKTKL